MQQSPLRRLWYYAETHRGRLIRAVLWSILNKFFDIIPPVLIGLAVDIAVNKEGAFLSKYGFETARSQLVALSLLTFVIWGLESVFEYLQAVAWRNLAQAIQHELRLDAYSHMQHLEMAFFEDESTGNLLAILNDDTETETSFTVEGEKVEFLFTRTMTTDPATVLEESSFVGTLTGPDSIVGEWGRQDWECWPDPNAGCRTTPNWTWYPSRLVRQ